MPLDERGQETMTVTVINANHCPGAVMYLFDGDFGRILYTGDFRYEPYMSIHTVLAGVTNVDVLYLDNTYNCNSCNFPTRSVAKTMVCDIIRSHPHDDVVIGVRNLGKEDLLEYIAEKLQTWIAVTPAYYNTLGVLQRRNVFTTDMRATVIRAVPMHLVKRTTLRQWNKDRPTIAILPTGLFFAEGSVRSTDLFVVPYSDHSSYSELEAFVKHVKPRLVVPIVREMSRTESFKLNGITDMSRFSRHLDTTASPTYQVPATQLRGTAVTRQPSIRRRDRCMTKRPVQRLKKKMGYEFTDVSPVKGDQNSLSASNHNLQQSHDQSYDRDKLMCVGCIRSPIKDKQSSPTADNHNIQQSCDQSHDKGNLTCVGLIRPPIKGYQSSPTSDTHDSQQSHDQSHDKDNLICVGFILPPINSKQSSLTVDHHVVQQQKRKLPLSSVMDYRKKVKTCEEKMSDHMSAHQYPRNGYGCRNKRLPASLCNLLLKTHSVSNACDQTDTVSDIGDQINKELLSPAQSSVTDKSVDIGDQINKELLSPAQSSVTDKSVDIGDQINEELLSPAQSSVTDKSVDFDDQINDKLQSPAQSSVTDKSVDFGDQINEELLSPAQSSVTDKSVDFGDQINEELLSPAQSSVTDKSVDIGDQINEELLSPAQSSVTDKSVDIGDQINEELSPAQSSVTDKSVDFDDQINDKLHSPAQSSVTDKNVDFGDQINEELLSPAQSSVTDKSVDFGDQINEELLSPAQSSVTDKSVDFGDQIYNELQSLAQSSVTDKSVDIGDQINEELLSPAQSSLTDKSVDFGDQINEELQSLAQSSVTDKSVDIGDQINEELLSPAQSSVTDKSIDIVNDIGDQINEELLSPGQSSVTDKSVDISDQINEELLSPAQSSVTNKSVDIGDHVNDELSAAERSLTDKSVDTVSDVIGDQINNELSLAQSYLTDKRVDTVSDISDQINNDLSPTKSSLTDKSVDTVNNLGDHDKDAHLSPAQRCFTDINVDIVSDTGDHDKDEPLSRAQRCLPDDVSDNDAHNINELCQFLCSSRTVPPAAKENTGKVTESFQLKVTRFHFRQVAKSATNVRHCGGSRHVKQKKVCASTQEEVNIQQYGYTRSVARTRCPVEVKVQDSSRAHLQKESGRSTGTSAATSICHVRPSVIPDCVQVPPRQTLQNSLEANPVKRSRSTSQEDVMSLTRYTEKSGDTRTETRQNVQNCQRANYYKQRHHSVVASVHPEALQLVHGPKKNTEATRTTNKRTHKLCECSERTRDGDNVMSTVFETDPDRLMGLMDALLDEEARKINAGNSWL